MVCSFHADGFFDFSFAFSALITRGFFFNSSMVLRTFTKLSGAFGFLGGLRSENFNFGFGFGLDFGFGLGFGFGFGLGFGSGFGFGLPPQTKTKTKTKTKTTTKTRLSVESP